MEVVIELLRAQCEAANQQPVTTKGPIIQILKEGECLVRKEKKNSNMKQLNGASDWKVSVDLKTSLQFPVHIIQTEKHPDIVVWSDSKKTVLLIELTVPWDETGRRHTNRRKTYTGHCVLTAWKRVGYAMRFLLRLVVVVF